MREHQRGKHVAVPRGKAVHVLMIQAFALQAFVKEVLVGIEVRGVGRVDDCQFATASAIPSAVSFAFDVFSRPTTSAFPRPER